MHSKSRYLAEVIKHLLNEKDKLEYNENYRIVFKKKLLFWEYNLILVFSSCELLLNRVARKTADKRIENRLEIIKFSVCNITQFRTFWRP